MQQLKHNVMNLLRLTFHDRKNLFFVFAPIPLFLLQPLLENILMRYFLDAYIDTPLLNFLKTLWILLACICLCRLIKTLSTIELDKRGAKQRMYLTSEIYQKTMAMDYEEVITTEGQKAYNLAMAAVGGEENTILKNSGLWLMEFLVSFLGITTFGILIIQLHPIIFLTICVGVIIQLFLYFKIAKQKRFINENLQTNFRKRTYVTGLLSNVRFLKDDKIFKMRPWVDEKMRKLVDDWTVELQKIQSIDFRNKVFQIGFFYVRELLTYSVIILQVLNHTLSVGEGVFFIGLVHQVSTWMDSIVYQIGRFQSQFYMIDHVNNFLAIVDDQETKDLSPETLTIAFDHVWFRYADEWILKDVTLSIQPGEAVAVVGINGAGKSTMMALLMGLLKPVKGRVTIGGIDVSSLSLESRRSIFSVIFQSVQTVPVSIHDFLGGGDIHDLWKILESVGLEHAIQRLPNGINSRLNRSVYSDAVNLSGGQEQRLLLARMIKQNRPIIVLDEPTAALDPIAEKNLYQLFSQTFRGKSTVYVTHRLASTKFCDYIVFMENGMLIEKGSHAELLRANGAYATLYHAQAKYYQEDVHEIHT